MSFPWPATLGLLVIALAVRSAEAKTLKVPSNNYPTIQEAVDHANYGDVIEISEGTYFETVRVVTAGITLRGDGAVVDAEYTGACIEVVANEVRLERLELRNGLGGVRCAGREIAIVENELHSSRGPAIEVAGDDARIRSNQLLGCRGGIYYESSSVFSTTKIEKNVVRNNDDASPIDASGGRLIVRKNEVFNVQDAIVLAPTHPALRTDILDNDIEGVEGAGIDLYSTGVGAKISGNQIRMVTGDGIIASGDNVEIVNNQVAWCEDDGIDLFGAGGWIAGNEVDKVGAEGIEYSGGGSTTIIGNHVDSAGQDGILAGGEGLTLSENKVTKCLGDGIDLQFGQNCRIEDNVCSKNAHEGIDNSGTNTRIDRNVAKKNGAGGGIDIAGRGNDGVGTVATFNGNKFKAGGKNVSQRLDYQDDEILP